jgi:hypothetical protein
MLKVMAYGIPAITLLVTSFWPAGLTLSLFVGGLLSAGQVTLLRNTTARSRLGLSPLPPSAARSPLDAPVTPSQYQPHIHVLDRKSFRTQTPTYQAPRTSGASRPGLVARFGAKMRHAAEPMRKKMEDMVRQSEGMLGDAAPKSGNRTRTKAELREAEAYEQRRAREDDMRLNQARMQRRKRSKEIKGRS